MRPIRIAALAPVALSVFLSLAAGEPRAQAGWQHRNLSTAPPANVYAMVWSTSTQTIWCLARNFASSSLEMWEYDGAVWRVMPVSNPPPTLQCKAAYDRQRQLLVAWGDGQTWEFDGTGWVQRAPATSPSMRTQHAMAYDSARGEVLLFGGQNWNSSQGQFEYFSDLWAWDGVNWTRKASGPMGSRGWAAMVDDPDRRVVVMHGGWYTVPQYWYGQQLAFNYSDTYEWDGTGWTQVASGGLRKAQAMAYDIRRERVVMFGGSAQCGYACGYYIDSTLEYDGATWTQVAAGAPTARNDAGMAYDERRQRVVLVGGFASGAPGMQDTWEYEAPAPVGFTAFGAGCAGSAGVPVLELEPGQLPWLGSTFALRVRSLPASGAAAMVVGLSNTRWLGVSLPLSLAGAGAPGCSLLVSAEVVLPLANQGGTALWRLPIPSGTSLLGLSFYAQAVAADAAANPAGIVVSNGGRATTGAR